MSYILDLAHSALFEQTASSRQNLKNLLKSVFANNFFFLKNIVDTQSELIFFVRPSVKSYRLATMWTFYFKSDCFKFQVAVYNKDGNDLLRALNDQMKIQIQSILRVINQSIMPFYCFFVDSQSSALKLQYLANEQLYSQILIRKQIIFNLIISTMNKLIQYDELYLFLEPIPVIMTQNPKKTDPASKINRFRMFLKNSKNISLRLKACLGDSFKLKKMIGVPKQNIETLKYLLLDSIYNYHRSVIGLEDAEQFMQDIGGNGGNGGNEGAFEKERQHIRKNQLGISTMMKKVNVFQTDKIVFGIVKIEEIGPNGKNKIQSNTEGSKKSKNQDNGEPTNQQQSSQPQPQPQPPTKQPSPHEQQPQQGAHSLIKQKHFKYYIAQTINQTTNTLLKQQKQKQLKNNKAIQIKQGELIEKSCNLGKEPSINSFRNQLAVIAYMRDMVSPFVARYYLMVKAGWDERDVIYMRKYGRNLLVWLMENKLVTLKTKLEIVYKIAKGLCFLYSKKVVHRDFKPQNIVMDAQLVPKIIDFGSCCPQNSTTTFKVHDYKLLTTLGFNIHLTSLPKTLPQHQHHKLQSKYHHRRHQFEQHPLFDMYAFGKTLSVVFFKTLNTLVPESFADDLMQNLCFLVNACTAVDPDDRPGFGEVAAFVGALGQVLRARLEVRERQRESSDEDGEVNVKSQGKIVSSRKCQQKKVLSFQKKQISHKLNKKQQNPQNQQKKQNNPVKN